MLIKVINKVMTMGELDRYCEQINLELTEQDVARLGWNKLCLASGLLHSQLCLC
ncbi:hypothetical protein OK016_20660 [Vibrio chagasii]|nr:hypothetical protein [Vibrio chagasii]